MATTNAQTADEGLQELYRELHEVHCIGRAAKLQLFCEKIWTQLTHGPPPSDGLLNGFVGLLQDDNDALLAQLVIPDLRSPSSDSASLPNAVKQSIVRRLRLQQPLFDRPTIPLHITDSEADRLYTEEKQILQGADLHRACLLIYGRVNVDETQKEDLRRWLDSYPREQQQG